MAFRPFVPKQGLSMALGAAVSLVLTGFLLYPWTPEVRRAQELRATLAAALREQVEEQKRHLAAEGEPLPAKIAVQAPDERIDPVRPPDCVAPPSSAESTEPAGSPAPTEAQSGTVTPPRPTTRDPGSQVSALPGASEGQMPVLDLDLPNSGAMVTKTSILAHWGLALVAFSRGQDGAPTNVHLIGFDNSELDRPRILGGRLAPETVAALYEHTGREYEMIVQRINQRTSFNFSAVGFVLFCNAYQRILTSLQAQRTDDTKASYYRAAIDERGTLTLIKAK